jgi:hypothetical protein
MLSQLEVPIKIEHAAENETRVLPKQGGDADPVKILLDAGAGESRGNAEKEITVE